MQSGLEHVRREILITLEVIPWRDRLIFFRRLEKLIENFKEAKDPLDIKMGNEGSAVK